MVLEKTLGRDAAERPPEGSVLSSGDGAGQAACLEAPGTVPTWNETQGRLEGRAVEETELWSPASRIWMVQLKYEMWHFL